MYLLRGFFLNHFLLNNAKCVQPLTGVEGYSIFLREGSLPGGRNYRMVAEGWTPGSEIATAEYVFKVNLVPYGGTCDVEPKEGTAKYTEKYYTQHKKCK